MLAALPRTSLSPLIRRAIKPPNLSTPLTLIPRVAMATKGAEKTHDFTASKLFDVSHITAIVTGGGTGIGLMISQALAANGAKVYITGRRKEVLETTISEHSSRGNGSIHALPGDVSDKEDVLRLAKEMGENEPDGIQLLVNNAGIARDDETKFSSNGQPDMSSAQAISSHFLKTSMSSWLETMQTNVAAGYYMSMAFLPLLARGSKPGKHVTYSSQIINVSSISGVMKGSSGGQFSYAASKAAFTQVSRMLASTFASVPVRCNTIAPGVFPSEMTTGESRVDNKSELDEGKAENPSKRFGRDEDMAGTVMFLAARSGDFYNDQIMYPDGGQTLVNPAYK